MKDVLEAILEMSDLDKCQSAEDMQYALEKIHDYVGDLLTKPNTEK